MRSPVLAAVLVLVGLAACGGAGGSAAGTTTSTTSAQSSLSGAAAGAVANATLRRVIDGDTIEVKVAGSVERVRLIGIDTPETKKPDTPVECFGPEASARTSALLPVGAPLRLVRDHEARDRFGRLLAYVQLVPSGEMVETILLREGLAGALTVHPNDTYASRFEALAAQARSAKVGLWGVCGSVHPR